jgi:hypothetical protein
LKPYFWKLMVGTFKKTLNNPTPKSVANLCYRLKEVYFQRLGSVSQSSFVRFFQNKIYSRVYVFSKVLLDFVTPILEPLEPEIFEDSQHEELIALPTQETSEIMSILQPEISNVDLFFNDYPYLIADPEPNSDGKYLVYKADCAEYEDLNSYYTTLKEKENVSKPIKQGTSYSIDEIEPSSKPKKKKKNRKNKVSLSTFLNNEWEDIQPESAFNEIDHFAFGKDKNDDDLSFEDKNHVAGSFAEYVETQQPRTIAPDPAETLRTHQNLTALYFYENENNPEIQGLNRFMEDREANQNQDET